MCVYVCMYTYLTIFNITSVRPKTKATKPPNTQNTNWAHWGSSERAHSTSCAFRSSSSCAPENCQFNLLECPPDNDQLIWIPSQLHVYVFVYISMYIYIYTYIYIYLFIHTYICTSVYAYIRTYVHTHLRTYIGTYHTMPCHAIPLHYITLHFITLHYIYKLH